MIRYGTGDRRFRGKFVDALKQAFHNGQLNFHGDLKLLAEPKTFAAWLRPLHRQDWVVYLKRPFGGPEYVLHYLGRYTHRVAISNHRLVSFADGQITFRWRDSADHNKQKLRSLSVNEFLTRFLLHLLPQGLVRIRHFGFLANRRRTTLLPLCFQLLGSTPQQQAELHASSTEDAPDLYLCPQCGGPMKIIERLTALCLCAKEFASKPLPRPHSPYFLAPSTSLPGTRKGRAPQCSLGTSPSSPLPPIEIA